MNIAIVTSCTGYGRYLHEWAASVCALKPAPSEVCIYTHGTQDDCEAGEAAAALIKQAGLPVARIHCPDRLDFGEARNRAVALSSAEWVQHLDADDMAMPHMLAEVAKVAPKADVVALGYERCGDLASGPRLRQRTYRSSAGSQALNNPTPASGCSPFRRSFWERAPYRTDLKGGWDTALWIGFAHLGARFVPTNRPGFWYRQHADSIFNTRRLSTWGTQQAGRRLSSLRRGDRGVSIIVPRGAEDSPERLAAWRWIRARYQALYPDWQVIEGFSERRHFCKGEAVEQAVEQARGAILVIADADSIVPAIALRDAVRDVEAGAPWVMPHKKVHRLSQAQTLRYLAAPPETDMAPPSDDLARPAYNGLPGGGIVVVSRPDYQATGGIPRDFRGWGAEDEALAVILDTLLGQHRRYEYPLTHLWHPPALHRREAHTSNRPLLQHFRAAAGDKQRMYDLICSPRVGPLYTTTSTRYAMLEQQQAARAGIVLVTQRSKEASMAKQKQEREQRQQSAAAFRDGQRARAAERQRNRLAAKARRAEKMQDSRKVQNKMLPTPEDRLPSEPATTGVRFSNKDSVPDLPASGEKLGSEVDDFFDLASGE